MRIGKKPMLACLLAAVMMLLQPIHGSHAIEIGVDAPIQTLPLVTPEPAPAVDPAPLNISLSWDNPTMTYRWFNDQKGRRGFEPSAVCIPVTITNASPCVDVEVRMTCSQPADDEMLTFFGGTSQAAVGISQTPQGPPASELVLAPLPGACAIQGAEAGQTIIYYSILPNPGLLLPASQIESIQSGVLHSQISYDILTSTPHHHEEQEAGA